MFTRLKMKNDILRNIFMLVPANKKGFLRESNFSQLLLKQKTCYNYPKYFQIRTIDILSSDIDFFNRIA